MRNISNKHSPKTKRQDATLKYFHGLTHTGLELLSQYFAGRTSVQLEELGSRVVSYLCVLFAFSAAAAFCLFTGRKQEAIALGPLAEKVIVGGVRVVGKEAMIEAARLAAQEKPQLP